MVSICVTCSVKGPPLSPLSDEHRHLLHAIVSPVVNMMELTAYPLHICVTCKLSIEEIHKFQQTAQRGVEAFKSLILDSNPELITIKTDPESDPSTIKQQFPSVPESTNVNLLAQIADVKHFFPNFSTRWQELLSTRKNALSEEIDIKFEPVSYPEAGNSSNVTRNVERTPVLVSNPDLWPFKVRSGPGGSNGSSFAGMQNMINNVVPYVQSNPGPKRISTQMQNATTKGNPVKSIHVAKFAKLAKIGQNLSSIKRRNPVDLQQNVSSNWHIAENAAKVDSNDGNFEVFTHEGRKNPAKEQGVRKVTKRIRKKPYVTCDYCEKNYKGKESLKHHINKMHLGLKCHFSCETCEKSFRNVVTLKLHRQSKHEQPKETTIDDVNLEWFCVECSLQFATRHQYKAHLTTLKHTPREQYAFVCENCQKRFPTQKRMQEHANAVHLNKKNFRCQMCEKTYVRKSDMRKHIRIAHEKREKERPHICHLCGNSFTAAKSLEDHLHAHQGLRPYECKLCPATFSYKAALYTHNRLKHLQMKTKKDSNVEEKKRKGKVKKAAVENEEEKKGRKVGEEAEFGSEVENTEKIQIELELIGHDADNLSIDSYLNEMM